MPKPIARQRLANSGQAFTVCRDSAVSTHIPATQPLRQQHVSATPLVARRGGPGLTVGKKGEFDARCASPPTRKVLAPRDFGPGRRPAELPIVVFSPNRRATLTADLPANPPNPPGELRLSIAASATWPEGVGSLYPPRPAGGPG